MAKHKSEKTPNVGARTRARAVLTPAGWLKPTP